MLENLLGHMLDFFSEAMFFVGLVVLGAIMVIIMTNKEIKTWIKTTVYLALSESFAAFLGWIAWQSYCNGNHSGAIVVAIVTVILAIVFLLIGIKGHKLDWRHVDSQV